MDKKLDKKDAYSILGLKEGASKDEIEKRYGVLAKRRRIEVMEEQGDSREKLNFDEINEAYRLLLGLGVVESPENEAKPNPVLKKMGIDSKKLENFIYYNKLYIIGGAVLLAFIISFIISNVTYVAPDLDIGVMGDIYINKMDSFQEKLNSSFPELKKIQVVGAITTGKLTGEQLNAGKQKALILIASGDVDFFILNKEMFDTHVVKGAFANLDPLVDELKIDKTSNKDYVVKVDAEEHLYGVDVSNSNYLKGLDILGSEKIAVIRSGAKNYNNAVKLLKLLLK